MQELDLAVLWIVFDEMLGVWLWPLLALVLFSVLGFAWSLVRERGLSTPRFVRAQAGGLVGGVLALITMAKVSSSGYTDAAGPIDWLLIGLVFGAGFVLVTLGLYAVVGCFGRRVS